MKVDPKKKIIEQKIERQKQKLLERLEKRKQSIANLYKKNLENKISKLQEKYNNKLERRIKSIDKQYCQRVINDKKKVKGQKIVKKISKWLSWKQKAFMSAQYLSKIERADKNWMVLQCDTMKVVHRSECVWWHIFPKGNYWHLATNLNNIRPISRFGNKKQLDSIWYNRWKNTRLSETDRIVLQELADNKNMKNKIRDEKYWENEYNKLQKQILLHETRLWLITKS